LKIRYKTIEEERIQDAPFVGALISAIDCSFNCKKCFNQPLKNLPTIEEYPDEIIKNIKKNKFNKGIILAGLEWSQQLNEAYVLLCNAKLFGLKTMLYTGFSNLEYFSNFCNRQFELIPEMNTELFNNLDYIKCGQYKANLATLNHIEYGVTLASSNQRIYKKGVDY
jgi:hypothetical protein